MKKSGGYIKRIQRILAVLLCLALLTGCGASGGDNQMPQINSKVAAAMEEDSQTTESTADSFRQKQWSHYRQKMTYRLMV